MPLDAKQLDVLREDPTALRPLAEYLRTIGYALPEVARLIGERDPAEFVNNAALRAIFHGAELQGSDSPVARIAALFLLNGTIAQSAYKTLPAEIRSLLERYGLVRMCADDRVIAEVGIGEYESTYMISDKMFEIDDAGTFSQVRAHDIVWPMSDWSLSLYRNMHQDPSWKTLLDVGCGSGCISNLAHRRYQSTLGIDINARAVTFSQINAALAAADTLHYETASCLTFVSTDIPKFDHIVFAAPSGPTGKPSGDMVHYGGELGNELVLSFLNDRVESLLSPHGSCQAWAVFAVEEWYESLENMIEESVPSDRFSVTVDALRTGGLYLSRSDVQGKVPPRGSHYAIGSQTAEWMEMLRDKGVVELTPAVVTLRFRDAS